MANAVEHVDGKLKTIDQIRCLITKSSTPIVFANMIDDWPAAKWTLDEFTKLFGDVVTKFKTLP